MRYTTLLLALVVLQAQPPATIRLIVKGDDMGAAHGINVATIDAYKRGVLTTTNVIVPGPWFLEAARLLRESLVLVVAGVLIGAAIALGTGRFVATLLFGLPPTDPLSLAAAIAVMVSVAAFAGFLPARRAARVDPMVALRYD